MKVLIISVRSDLGGGPEHIYGLVGSMPNVDFRIACPQEGTYYLRFASLIGLNNITIIPHRRFSLEHFFALLNLVRKEKIDLVHSHGKGAGLYGRLIALVARSQCLHTFHGLHVGEYGKFRRSAYFFLERVLGWFTSMAICVSEGEHELIRRYKLLPKSKLQIVNNGVYVPNLVSRANCSEFMNIVAVSRFDYQKNPELLMDIAQILKSSVRRKYKIIVLGHGERMAKIKNQIIEKNLKETVELYGPHQSPREVFRQCQIFLSSSRWEGMPLAVLEAMSEGLCPVLTNVVGNRDIVKDDHNGRLFDLGSPVEAARIIEDLSVQKIDNLGQMARYTVEVKYSIETMAQKTLDLYRKLLSSS